MGSKADYKMLNRFPWLSKVKMVLSIFALLAVGVLVGPLVGIAVLILFGPGDGAPTVRARGEVLIESRSESDAEFVGAAVGFLRETNWWQDDVRLAELTRYLQCSDVHALSNHDYTVTFRGAKRTSPFRKIPRWMWVHFVNKGTMLQYGIDDYEDLKFRSFEGIDLSQIKVDSVQVLEIAELSGGEAFRASFANRCKIIISLSFNDEDWWIHYYASDALNRYLQLEISSVTGEVILKEGPLLPEG